MQASFSTSSNTKVSGVRVPPDWASCLYRILYHLLYHLLYHEYRRAIVFHNKSRRVPLIHYRTCRTPGIVHRGGFGNGGRGPRGLRLRLVFQHPPWAHRFSAMLPVPSRIASNHVSVASEAFLDLTNHQNAQDKAFHLDHDLWS